MASATTDIQAAMVTAALARLTPEHREIIRLAHHRGMSVREIATRMDLSELAVSRRILFALRSLRLILNELEIGAPPAPGEFLSRRIAARQAR